MRKGDESTKYAFGETWYQSSSGSRRFTTYERDAETGNDYALARFGTPTLGRFLSPDPVAASPDSPQSWNRYSYVLNDPGNLVDPLGLKHEETNPVWNWSNSVTVTATSGWFPNVKLPQVDAIALLQFSIIAQLPTQQFVAQLSLSPAIGRGGPAAPKINCKDPKWAREIGFYKAHLGDATLVAQLMATKPEFLLGHSANESSYGTELLATQGGNYFGSKYGSFFRNFRIGKYANPLDNLNYNKYDAASGFLDSASSLVSGYYGAGIYGAQTPQAYTDALTKGAYKFNSNPNYAATIEKYIKEVTDLVAAGCL